MVDEVVGRRRYWVLAAAMTLLACGFAVPAAARAEQFTVNSAKDKADSAPGVGCLPVLEECTLRAAIEEANGSEGEFDEVVFDESVFDGQLTGTIVLGSSLPAIEDPISINGKGCPTAAGVSGPCVGIDGPGGGAALIVDETEEAEIWGLAVTGAQTGVSVDASPHFKAQASWFGVKLDGSPAGNATGILVGPGSNRTLIGSEGPERGNVFAGNAGDGLEIHGASHVRVLGNYFGVEKDGATQAANGKDIEVTSTSGGEFEATGNAIGTRVSSEAAATPLCDGGCNVISSSESSGIDLQGDGGAEAPAVATTVAGNYIGLDPTGSTAVPNATSGVRVGQAPQTVVGGPKAGEANRINGGSVGVLAGPEAADLVVGGNLIGVDSAGTGSLGPPGEGISVSSGELPSPALEAAIAGNRIFMEGGVAIAQKGFGARIAGNEILGAEIGIETSESTAEHGNLIEGNSIAGLKANGILVENDLNEIVGNEVFAAAGAGILIRGALPFGVSENLVGGDAAADENVIADSGGAAIEISDVNASENEVARNRGSANGGLFIDLVAAGAEAKGPNNGIEPPQILTPTQASAAGSGALPGATVRVFRKQTAAAGELDSFLGEAIADAEGNWKAIYESAIPAGASVAATQTSGAGGTSELTPAATVPGGGIAEGGGAGGDTGSGAVFGDQGIALRGTRLRPRTKIVAAPRKSSRRRTARFEFESSEAGSVFLCRLDDKPFDLCRSPKRYRGLEPGRHMFEVRAVDRSGRVDSSPAKTTFTVLR